METDETGNLWIGGIPLKDTLIPETKLPILQSSVWFIKTKYSVEKTAEFFNRSKRPPKPEQ
jgi:hypothetical protein